MKLEVGKEYITREGEKAICLSALTMNKKYDFAVEVEDDVFTYKKDGTFLIGEVSDSDIVALWSAEVIEVEGIQYRRIK